ncbi:SCO4226 family nickel-binding protein [Streptomyces purpureus]|uniref:Guanylate cyclase n=1 Tax=Streptomyces purpureus TaxID=1951 RepID=A0A918H5F4_9ACTN|nr:SCO4226 family nickel-binding protein [Streptomyces purpureus]GGT36210.1 guanylate cyclase [Streptomyces purpureus]
MGTYMDVHRGMVGITAEQLNEAHQADLAIEKDEGVHFRHAWADPKSGTVYCLSDAPSAEAVQRIHERTGHAADEIHPVPLAV